MTELRPSASLAGQVLGGRYRLERALASGGMAQVWEATDEVLTRHVAVKVLHPHLAADKSFVMRFRREAIAAARLAHPAIVSIFDTVSQDGVEAIVMELVPGRTLKEWLEPRRGEVDFGQAVFIVTQVADALEVAHRAGIVHRDIKPANILVSDDGRVLVTDFGIAKAVAEADITNAGTTLGTARYLAPEQVMGRPVDARADVYSLGVVLYELLCGRCPFNGDTEAAIMMARIHEMPLHPRQVRADVPKPLDDVVMRALNREPGQRYSRAADLRAALLMAYGSRPLDLAGSIGLVASDGPPASNLRWADDVTSASLVPLEPAGGDTGQLLAPTPVPAAPARPWPAEPEHRVSPAQTTHGRTMPIVVVTLIVITALAVAGLLLKPNSGGGSDPPDSTPPTTAAPGPVAVTGVTAFDPSDGTGNGENNGDAHLASDGNPFTSWGTEHYNSRQFGNLKTGVGLVVEIPAGTNVSHIDVSSPTRDWSYSVYVADSAKGTIGEWGQLVTSHANVNDPTTTTQVNAPVGAVLIWITDLGNEPRPTHAEISEVTVYAS